METDICNIKCEPELDIYDIVEINEDGEPNSEMFLDEDEVDKSCKSEDKSTNKKLEIKKPHKCDICDATFRHNYILKVHKRIHSDVKPFICDICNQSFRHRHTLKTHKNTHIHEKPYICDICDRAFSLANTLRDHRYLHSEERAFKCDVCEKSFRNPPALRHHKRIHSDKRFNCDMCDASYTRHSNLKSHKLIHTGDWPFQCNVCARKFRERRYYRDHKCGGSSSKQDEEGVVDVCN